MTRVGASLKTNSETGTNDDDDDTYKCPISTKQQTDSRVINFVVMMNLL